ncbi:hypothetical protein, partial [Frankia sp. AiPa1]|uniref:hypothetical protein n=1 Tax=Frankia sp. AiPa1 TaxID=573492 RepID=UPI00202ACC7C
MRVRLQEIADALLGQTSIPLVLAQADLLEELGTDEWWQDVTGFAPWMPRPSGRGGDGAPRWNTYS